MGPRFGGNDNDHVCAAPKAVVVPGGKARVQDREGLENTDAIKDQERNRLTEADFTPGHRMACQTFVSGEIAVSWVPLALRPPLQPRPPPGRPPIRTASA